MVLLLVRHVTVIVRDVSMLQDATVLFSVSPNDLGIHLYVISALCFHIKLTEHFPSFQAILQFVGFFLPCYVIARFCYAFQHRRRRQVLPGFPPEPGATLKLFYRHPSVILSVC